MSTISSATITAFLAILTALGVGGGGTSQLAAISGAGSGLVAHYTFDEGSGTTAGDSAGSNTGTLTNGPTWTSGKIGNNALSLNGSSYISAPSGILGTSAATACAWIYPTTLSGINVSLIDNHYFSFYIYNDTTNNRLYLKHSNDGSGNGAGSTINSISTNQWQHVCATRDASGLSNIYVNASLSGSADQSGGVPSGSPYPTLIGAYPGGSASGFFNGSIDDVRIYSRALSSSEITEIYNYTGSGGGTPTNGVCSTSNNVCSSGSSSDQTDSSTQYLWQCLGSGGGTTASCSLTIPTSPVSGICGSSNNVCTAGSLSDTSDTSTLYQWQCLGLNGGSTASCSQTIPTSTYTLSTTKSGTGSGTVTGGSINCGSTCSQSSISSGTSITLTATPQSGSTFSGWSGGGCSGMGTCTATITANTTVTATFTTSSGGSTVTAASCNNTDVQSAISSVTDGGTVIIPAGTCTWNQTVSIGTQTSWNPPVYSTKSITIKGAGIGNTVIISNISTPPGGNPRGSMISYGTKLGGLSRITGLTLDSSQIPNLDPNVYSPGMIEIGGDSQSWRIDNVHFIQGTGRGINANGANFYGAIDHNIFDVVGHRGAIYIFHDGWNGKSNGDGSWADLPYWGSEKAIFIEDNIFNHDPATGGRPWATDGWSGGRMVFRYNTVNNMGTGGGHGLDSGGRLRSMRTTEMYNNNIFMNDPGVQYYIAQLRGGSFLIFNNTMTNNFPGGFFIENYRDWEPFAPWGKCDGASPFDLNDNVTYDTGTYTGTNGARVFITTGKNWVTNQWAGYNIHNITKGQYSNALIISNTSNTITTTENSIDRSGNKLTWNNGDSFKILRATACMDQRGRGTGNLISGWELPWGTGITPEAWPNQVLEPTYAWNNTLNGASSKIGSDNPFRTKEGVEFYNDIPMPGYTPYVYPHPLVTGGTVAVTPTTPPTSIPTPDTTLPTISLTSPTSGSTVSGSSVSLSATASDNIGVIGVQFKLDGTNLSSELTTAPYSGTWDTTGVSNGTHTLTAVARDSSGNTKTSSSVTVTVSNTVPVTTTPSSPTTPVVTTPSTGTFTPTVTQRPSSGGGGGGTTLTTLAAQNSQGQVCKATNDLGRIIELFISLGIIKPDKVSSARSYLCSLSSSTTTTGTKFTLALDLGSRNTEVTTLQTYLISQKLLETKATGYFGPATAKAVGLFQQKYNLSTPGSSSYGFVGPKTRAKLNEVVK